MPNRLYYGDNLEVLRLHVKDETVDLVYLDPPFKSNQDYNILFAEKTARLLPRERFLPRNDQCTSNHDPAKLKRRI